MLGRRRTKRVIGVDSPGRWTDEIGWLLHGSTLRGAARRP